MAWIESHTTMRNHKKLIALCNTLQINRAEAIGHLHMLWWWAIEHRESGDLTGLFDKDIAVACDWDGDVKLLIDSLHKTEWLTNYHITDWDDYSYRLLNMRKSNRERQRKHRNTSVTRDVTCYVPPATIPNLTKHKESNSVAKPLDQNEVIEYFKSQKSTDLIARDFFEYYESNGWRVGGRASMKNWKMAANRWIRKNPVGVKNEPRKLSL